MVVPITPKHSLDYGGSMLNVFHAKVGEGLEKHSHTYAHATICHSGKILIRKEGKVKTMSPEDNPINLLANEWHEIEALEDNTVFANLFAKVVIL